MNVIRELVADIVFGVLVMGALRSINVFGSRLRALRPLCRMACPVLDHDL